MPGVRRKDRAKTQPVTFEAEGKAEADRAESAAAADLKATKAAASLGSVRRHVRSDSTPNMPALQEAMAAQNGGGGGDEDADKVKWGKDTNPLSPTGEEVAPTIIPTGLGDRPRFCERITEILLYLCMPDSAWASGNLAEWALPHGHNGGNPKSESTKHCLRGDA